MLLNVNVAVLTLWLFYFFLVIEVLSSLIVRKNLMEAELVRSKNDMMSLNNQLLEAIQRKLELSQELEAWQVGALSLHVFLLFTECTPV